MKIQKVRAKNFLSIGNEGIEIDFAKYGNIVLIKGQNLDISPNSSNGAGKSTLIECIVYGFYGKMIKGLNHKEALNKKTKKALRIEIEFECNGHQYLIVRTRKPDNLELFCLTKQDPKDSSKPLDETRGGMPETQKAIEEHVKLSAEAFINVVCLGEHNNHAFLSLKAEDRRAIVENLLGLEKYIKYNKQASTVKNAMEAEQKIALKKYDTLLSQRKSIEDRISQLNLKWETWRKQRLSEIASVESMIVTKQNELEESSDDGTALLAYHEAQKKILEHKNEILQLEARRTKLATTIENEIDPKLLEITGLRQDVILEGKDAKHALDRLALERDGIVEQNKQLEKLGDGVKCKHCYGVIEKKNYESVRLQNTNKIEGLESKIEVEKAKILVIGKRFKDIEEKLAKVKEAKATGDNRLSLLNKQSTTLMSDISALSKLKEPNSNIKEIQLREQLNALESRLATKQEELVNDPYTELVASTETELQQADAEIAACKADVEKRAELLPYYEFWVTGFGDKGIRSFIIDEKLPALNARINYWLQFLIENKLQLKFDKEFEPTIERNPVDGDPFVYSATSGGERRRINLSISQAFGYITMMSADIFVNMISLDEVALNVDLQGVHGIYKMINELARDRQVLVTTHDPNLLELLENCDVINVVKKDGFTTLASAEELTAA
jgi:DNA repair exonuclease SbcCD ATPase subunit